MEYQKIANLIDGASNQPSKFRRKNWVEINDDSSYVDNTKVLLRSRLNLGFNLNYFSFSL